LKKQHGQLRVISFLTFGISLLLLVACLTSSAQTVAPITPSGLNTLVSDPLLISGGKTQYDITGGTRPGGGANLFHSFGEFNVPTNNIANFLNAGSVDLAGNPLAAGLPTSNILGRVTGGNVSNIFGMIQTGGFGNANLFLMNPTGFLFGPNATLNVGGMVAFTSADYLRLQGGPSDIFYANPAEASILTSAPVAAYGFLGSNPGAITIKGSQLSVTPAQSISLVGGNITIQSETLEKETVQPAHLSAPNGQINFASTSSPGEFILQSLQTGGFQQFPTPFGPANQFVSRSLTGSNVDGASFTSFGTVHLAPGSVVDTSQPGNSKVSIIGGQFVVDIQNALLTTASTPPTASGQDNVILRTGSSIFTGISSTDHGPDIQILADTIQVLGTFAQPPTPSLTSVIATSTSGSGTAGNISLTASANLDLATAQVSSNVPGGSSGTAANIALTSTQRNVVLTNFTLLTTQGHPGTLTLNAPHGDIILDMSLVNTQVQSPAVLGVNGGGIQIAANNLTLSNSQNLVPASIDGINFANLQVPGDITVTLSGNLSMSGGSAITTVSRGPAAGAADLNITAHDVSLTGTGQNPPNPQVFNTRLVTQTISSGTGGQLNIVADNLQLTNGGQLQSGSVIGRNPFTGQPTNPSGPGGTININGHSGPITSVLIDGAGSGIFTNSQGSGLGGNTNITAQSITVQNGGVISAQANGSGPGGQMNILTDNLQLISGGQLTSGSVIGRNPITGQPLPPPSGTGGDITVMASGSVTMTNNGSISASSTGTGNAGNIQITAGNQFTMTNSKVTTEANQASGGSVKITTVPNGRVELTNSTISASVLDGTGGGGSVNIDPQYVILQNSQILANAVFGPGGNINITTNLLLPDTASVISASSQFGQQGTISIQSPISPASGKINPIGHRPLIPTSMVSQRCAALAGGNASSFTVAGRDSVPPEPGGWLSSPLALVDGLGQPSISGLTSLSGSVGTEIPSHQIDQTNQTDQILSLRRIAPPGFLTQSFVVGPSSGCAS
jgi:filamentous hemagglutinin family protein